MKIFGTIQPRRICAEPTKKKYTRFEHRHQRKPVEELPRTDAQETPAPTQGAQPDPATPGHQGPFHTERMDDPGQVDAPISSDLFRQALPRRFADIEQDEDAFSGMAVEPAR